jgi:hypothetical protein
MLHCERRPINPTQPYTRIAALMAQRLATGLQILWV